MQKGNLVTSLQNFPINNSIGRYLLPMRLNDVLSPSNIINCATFYENLLIENKRASL